MSVRWTRAEEWVPDLHKANRRISREAARPTGTERAQTMDTAIQAAADSTFAKDLAEQLEVELGPLPGQIQAALAESAAAVAESGLARSEAAVAVADAARAAADATDAIEEALAAAALVAGSNTWADRAPVAADAVGKPTGAIWFQYDGSGLLGGFWELRPTGWLSRDMSETVIPKIAIGVGTYGTLSGSRLVARSILAEHIAALAITAEELAANSVTAVKIAANSVTAEKINAGAVTTDKLDALAVTAEKIAAGAIIAEKLAAGAVVAETIAAGALDAITIRGAQIYGGYIESPVIASSDRLGSGANVLNDPGFSGTVNGSWVLSGHTGDAAVTQTDTITWDKSWTAHDLYPPKPVARRNWGNVVAQLRLTPAVRKTGSLIFANYAWLNATSRTITNPYPFPNEDAWSSFTPTGGSFDPSFYEVDNRPPLAGVARTSYLTNTKVQPVVSGERWNVRLEFIKMAQARSAHIDSITVEIINNANSSVVWSRPLLADEIAGGLLNDWWDTTFTGNVRYRIKTVYKAAGGAISRRPNSGSFARWSVNGAEQSGWAANSNSWLSYKSRPTESASDSSLLGYHSVDYQQRARQMELIATSAMLAKVEPVAGWRLSEDEGFELFNSLGARTGKIDGENNFLAGTFATREEGRRLQIKDEVIGWYANDPTPRSRINEDADGLLITSPRIRLNGSVDSQSDIPWSMASNSFLVFAVQLKNGWTNNINPNWDGLQTMKRLGVVFVTGAVTKATAYGALEVIGTLPAALRPGVPTMMAAHYTFGATATITYVLVRANGDIVTATSGSGGQIAVTGTLIP